MKVRVKYIYILTSEDKLICLFIFKKYIYFRMMAGSLGPRSSAISGRGRVSSLFSPSGAVVSGNSRPGDSAFACWAPGPSMIGRSHDRSIGHGTLPRFCRALFRSGRPRWSSCLAKLVVVVSLVVAVGSLSSAATDFLDHGDLASDSGLV